LEATRKGELARSKLQSRIIAARTLIINAIRGDEEDSRAFAFAGNGGLIDRPTVGGSVGDEIPLDDSPSDNQPDEPISPIDDDEDTLVQRRIQKIQMSMH
jgi:hypothetical protein